jgi:hypothetical protein
VAYTEVAFQMRERNLETVGISGRLSNSLGKGGAKCA